ncbi:GTP cyclohydrolase II, partial [Staphylococcus chromogenes]
KYDIDIKGRIPLITNENENNHDYLEVKKTQMGHLI